MVNSFSGKVSLDTKKWEILSPNPVRIKQIANKYNLNSLVAKILVARGITEPKSIENLLNPRLSDVYDPYILKDMDIAAERIAYALKNREKIIIYGDYDVDGVTATALLIRFFKFAGHNADYYIPHRVNEGYGLSKEAIERFGDKKYSLMVTVDNGISSLSEVDYAHSLGIDVIVTDHHVAGDEIPSSLAVVNPTRKDCPYPFEGLSGVGVAFKLAQAVARKIELDTEEAESFLMKQLDLVALGTIADIVPLLDENRVFVRYGLEYMEETHNVGLRALMEVAGVGKRSLRVNDVAFYLAPRLNAAGRTDHASICVELLLLEDPIRAGEIARYLNKLNNERRKLENGILVESLEYIRQSIDLESNKLIVVEGEGWHNGVLGIVASKLLDRYYRPSIVLGLEKDMARGSARSIVGYNIHEALTACEEHLLSYGGHTQAAGLEVKRDSLDAFKEAIGNHARATLSESDMIPRIQIDAVVEADDLTFENVKSLDALNPFGASNALPIFALRKVFLLEEPRIVGRNHLKLVLCHNGLDFDAIGFSMGDYLDHIDWTRTLDVAFHPSINTYRGNVSVQLELKDIIEHYEIET